MKKIIRFPGRGNNKILPPTVRIRSMFFYGPKIKLFDGRDICPCVSHVFETPATDEQATDVIAIYVVAGGIDGKMGDDYIFIPWPCAAIYFELVDLAAGDPKA